MIDARRTIKLNDVPPREGPVVYWMTRDQRAQDNWAMLFAQQLAHQAGRKSDPLGVVFCLTTKYFDAVYRHYAFMLKGLQETAARLQKTGISFHLLLGEPGEEIPRFCRRYKVATLLTDFLPLRIKTQWIQDVLDRIDIPFYEVDAHNIVPAWHASEKQEYSARTMRARLQRLVPEFLTPLPPLRKNSRPLAPPRKIPWEKILREIDVDRSVGEVNWIVPGYDAGMKTLREFLRYRLGAYEISQNDPTVDGTSNLSPYLHFGQISPHRVALEVGRARASESAKKTFLEQLIVRRELADNFCLYCEFYDSFEGLPAWGKRTLTNHLGDHRRHLFSLEKMERGESCDPLWDAAQRQMVATGKMHGYLRMYWAKKMLEWNISPQQAIEWALYLNDKYELDGRDPNGYVGVLWSIGGLHDTPFPRRPIFGNVRSMTFEGCKRKFNVEKFITQARSWR